MGHQIQIDLFAEAVIKGIKKAQRNYEKWSGGEWLWTAAEYMLTVHVAKALSDLDGAKYVTIEHNGLQAINLAGAVAPGPKPKKARLRGRFDILLWWGGGTPRAVIELKNQPCGSDVCIKDFHRIKEVLGINQEENSIQFGLFGFYTSAKDGSKKCAEDKVLSKLKKIKDLADDTIGKSCKVIPTSSKIYIDGTGSAWAAGCLSIMPR